MYLMTFELHNITHLEQKLQKKEYSQLKRNQTHSGNKSSLKKT